MNTEGLSKTQIADAQLEVEPQAPEEVVAEVVAPAPEPEPAPAPLWTRCGPRLSKPAG